MPNFCKKCGSMLNATTGKCPVCDHLNEKPAAPAVQMPVYQQPVMSEAASVIPKKSNKKIIIVAVSAAVVVLAVVIVLLVCFDVISFGGSKSKNKDTHDNKEKTTFSSDEDVDSSSDDSTDDEKENGEEKPSKNKVYDVVIKQYAQAAAKDYYRDNNDDDNKDEYVSETLIDTAASREVIQVQYTFYDINKDGTPELIVSDIDSMYGIYDVFTTDGEQIYPLIEQGEFGYLWERLTICEDGLLRVQENNSTGSHLSVEYYSLQPNATAVEFIEGIERDNGEHMKTDEDGEKIESIESEEFDEINNMHPEMDLSSLEWIKIEPAEETDEGEWTIEALAQKYLEANKIYIGWVCPAFEPEFDESDSVDVNDRKYYRIKNTSSEDIDELKDWLGDYFLPEFYEDYVDSSYVSKDNKLYGAEELGQGGQPTTKVELEIVSNSENKCVFKISTFDAGDDEPSVHEIVLELIDDEWIFTKFTGIMALFFGEVKLEY